MGMRGAIFSILLMLAGMPLLHADDSLAVADRLIQQHLTYIYGSEDLHKGGLDCSGFIQIVFHDSCGIDLPNEADKQLDYCREYGQVWDSTSGWTPATLQPGDLIFFAGPDLLPRTSLVSHVMIYCGHAVMAGAQGKGQQIDGSVSGVGYYPFGIRSPQGVLGESGTRFIGHRRIFAYGRLTTAPLPVIPAAVAALPASHVNPPVVRTSVAITRNTKPFGINPRLD